MRCLVNTVKQSSTLKPKRGGAYKRHMRRRIQPLLQYLKDNVAVQKCAQRQKDISGAFAPFCPAGNPFFGAGADLRDMGHILVPSHKILKGTSRQEKQILLFLAAGSFLFYTVRGAGLLGKVCRGRQWTAHRRERLEKLDQKEWSESDMKFSTRSCKQQLQILSRTSLQHRSR